MEWVGVLEKRAENWKFEDVETSDLPNGYVEFVPEKDAVYEIRPKTQQDVGVQVSV